VKLSKQDKFLELYEPVSRKISNYCRFLTKDKAEAEDLLHDTILACFEKIDELKSDKAFPSFMFSTAFNIFSKQVRRNKFKGSYNDKTAGLICDMSADPQVQAEFSIILEKMKKLPKVQYEALIMYHISDLAMNDISKIQGVSLSAVKKRLKTGRENLLSMLNEKQRKVAMLML
jgi:RNA polymerase sigma factor (sigma-70 family)